MKMNRRISIVSTFTAPVKSLYIYRKHRHTGHFPLNWCGNTEFLQGKIYQLSRLFVGLSLGIDFGWRGHVSMSSVSPFFEIAPGTLMGSFNMFQPSGSCGGCLFFLKLVSYLHVFFSMVFGCTSCFLVLKGINTSGGFQSIYDYICFFFLLTLEFWIVVMKTNNHNHHTSTQRTLADRCHSEQVGRCGTRCRWATKAEGRWEGSHYLAKDVEIRTVTPPHELIPKMMGYGKWISAGFKIGYLCQISWGVDLLDNEHRLFVATYVILPEMFEILWRQDECTDYFAYQVDSCQTLCLPKPSSCLLQDHEMMGRSNRHRKKLKKKTRNLDPWNSETKKLAVDNFTNCFFPLPLKKTTRIAVHFPPFLGPCKNSNRSQRRWKVPWNVQSKCLR